MKKILFLLFSLMLCAETYAQQSSNMVLLKNLNQHGGGSNRYSAIWGWTSPTGREYAIMGCQTGTAFIDITDSANIRECDFVTGVNSGWREMKAYSHYAYVVSEGTNSKLQIIDLQYLPDSVRLVKTFSLPNYSTTHSISQTGPYIMLNGANATFNEGTTILDCSVDPENPVMRDKWNDPIGGNTDGYVHDCRMINDTIWASNIYTGYITIIDARNKDSLKSLKTFQTTPNPFTHNSALTKDHKYLFTTDETSTPPGTLKIWNVSNLNNITFSSNWRPAGNTTSIVHNVEIYGDTALIAHYTAGIRLLDISNPTTPVEIAYYDTYPSSNANQFNGCWGVYMFPASKKIIASDMATGFYVVKPTVVTGIGNNNTVVNDFKLEQNYPNPFNPTTNVKFSLAKNSNVSIKLYDVNGREVAALVNDNRDAGTYSINIDAGNLNLSSGIYFYKMTTGDFSDMKKMILVK